MTEVEFLLAQQFFTDSSEPGTGYYLTLIEAESEFPRLSSQEIAIESPLRPDIWKDR